MKKIHKLSVNVVETGIQLDIDGAPEGINIEFEVLPEVIAAMVAEAVGHEKKLRDVPKKSVWHAKPGV